MKLNSNQAFNLLGIICLIAIFGAMIVAAWAGLSTAGIIITGVVAAMIGNFAGMIMLAKYSSEQDEPIDGFNIDDVKVARTALSTGIEILVDVLTALAWVMAVKNGLFTQEDGSFGFEKLLGLFLFTGTIAFMLWETYTPGNMNNAGMLTNIKQVKLAVIMNRLLAVLMAAGMLIYTVPAFHQHDWILIVLAVIGVVVFAAGRILIRRAK